MAWSLGPLLPVELRDGMRVLDLGTGIGTAAFELAGLARDQGVRAEIVGLDADGRRREVFEAAAAEQGFDDVRFVERPAHRLDGLGRFDLVLHCGCLSQHVVVPLYRFWSRRYWHLRWRLDPRGARLDRIDRIFEATAAVARPGAGMLLIDIDPEPDAPSALRGAALWQARRWPLLPEGLVVDRMTKAGWSVVSRRRQVYLPEGKRAAAERFIGEPAGRLYSREPVVVPTVEPGDRTRLDVYAVGAVRGRVAGEGAAS